MPDWELTGNLATCVLLAASVAVWAFVIVRLRRNESPLPLQPREPCAWHAIAVALALPVSILVTYITLSASPPGAQLSVERVQALCLAHVLEALVLMGVLAVGSPIRAEDFGLHWPGMARDVGYGVLGVLASLIPVYAVNILVQMLGWREEGAKHDLIQILEANPEPSIIAWAALSAVVLAPMVEELLYRVVLQGWLETRLPPRSAILFVSFLFAWVHYEPGRPDYLPLFPLALILGYVYRRRHSYPAVVALHASFNAMNLAFAVLWGSQTA